MEQPRAEVVLAVNGHAEVVGATLGNDVNLRDIEGRSALLLARPRTTTVPAPSAPSSACSTSTSRWTRAPAEVSLRIEGAGDGFVLEGVSRMQDQPRPAGAGGLPAAPPYPDGFMLFLGTMFSPIQPRRAGAGFTHQLGDRVTIASPLGALVNTVQRSDAIRPGPTAGALMRHLRSRRP
jgi:fumarylacetoacetate (FAA) hydrolase family protein